MQHKVSYIFKTRYYIEPSGPFGWVFRREGSDKVIKRAKYRQLLLAFASEFVQAPDDEVCVCDENGMLVDIKKF